MVRTTELYYFPKSQLLCTTNDGVNFDVLNGAWYFELHGDVGVDKYGKEHHVGAYEEHTRKSFNECYPNFGH